MTMVLRIILVKIFITLRISISERFKQRVINCFIQDWLSTVQNTAALNDYSLIKHTFGYEPYLDILSRDMRIYFTRLRFSTLNLRIETVRYRNIPVPRSEKFCPCCNATDIEDSYHFFFYYFYAHAITKLDRLLFVSSLPVYFRNRPSVFKFTELLQSQDKNIIKKPRFTSKMLLQNDWKYHNA